jgi:hypothetical protein
VRLYQRCPFQNPLPCLRAAHDLSEKPVSPAVPFSLKFFVRFLYYSQAVAVDPTVHFTFPLKAFLPIFSSHISCPGFRFSCKIHFISILYRWVLGSRDIFARCSWLHFPNTASFNSDRFACGGALSPSSPLVLFRRINP